MRCCVRVVVVVVWVELTVVVIGLILKSLQELGIELAFEQFV